MRAKVLEKIEVAQQTLAVKFDLLGQNLSFVPGQYCFITFLNPPEKGKEKRDIEHHFSIVNSPNEKGIIEICTRIRQESVFKQSLSEISVGSEAEIDRVGGDFILPQNVDKPLTFIALGIGVTPFVSISRYCMEEKKDYEISLIYSDSETESMPFLDEFKKLEKENSKFKLIMTVTRDEKWQGEKRHVDGQFLKDYFDEINNRFYFVSGPPKAVEAVGEALKKEGIPKQNVKTEDFYGY